MSNQSWVSKINSLVLSLQFLLRSHFKPCDTTFRGRYQFYSPWKICFDDWNTMQSVQIQHHGLLSKTTTTQRISMTSSCRCENIPVSKFMVLKVPSILWNMQMAQHCTSTHPCWLFFQRQWNTSRPLIINSKDSKTLENFPNGFCPIKFLTKQMLILKESSHDLKLHWQCFKSSSIIGIWYQVITFIWMI